MRYYAVQLVIERYAEVFCVFFYALYADEYVAFDNAFSGGGGEGDDVGVIIVVEVLEVDAMEVFIVAEYEVEMVKVVAFGCYEVLQPGADGVAEDFETPVQASKRTGGRCCRH